MSDLTDEIEVTPELLMQAFEDAKAGVFVEDGLWTLAEACSSQIDMGFITLKNGKRYLVSVKIEDEEEID